MAFSLVMRTELAETGTIISAETYNQMFTMHGSIMLFLFILPVSVGFMNYIVPLQIGAVDMAFPRINALSYWMFLFAGVLIVTSFAVDGGARRPGGRPTRRSPAIRAPMRSPPVRAWTCGWWGC